MFEDLIRELRNMGGVTQIRVQLEIDDKGYFDRHCPAAACGSSFKVAFEDWENIVSDESVFCPRCGHSGQSTEWNTPAQEKHIRQAATNHIHSRLDRAMQRGARSFNASQRRTGFITLSMSYRPGHRPVLVPVQAEETMTQTYECDHCGCRYASVGAAFFCPACGESSVLASLPNSLETTKNTVRMVPGLYETIEQALGKDAAEDSARQILENQMVKLAASFQNYAEERFARLENAARFTIRRNIFQRISDADILWREATDTGYRDILTAWEYDQLVMYFQQRHVLEHQDGFIDQDYIDRSGDPRFRVGQRLVVSEANVLELVAIIEKLTERI